jgi:hypothetical protein
MNSNFKTVTIMVMFATFFILVGTYAPILYATTIPSDQVIEVDTFEPTDTHVDEEQHLVCWERDVSEDRAANIRTELILLSSDTNIEIDRTVRKDIIEKGDKSLKIESDLPEDIKAGTYRYNAIITVELANGRVDRSFEYQSETFRVYENETALKQHGSSSC